MPAPLPENEIDRLAYLQELHLLDTPSSPEFDDIVRLAAYVCDVSVAGISFVDNNREWFKSILGKEITEVPRDYAFCAYTILQSDLLVVEDALSDDRFATNPLVTGKHHIRFYAGMPIVTDEGFALGALCVIDTIPKTLTKMQSEALQILAKQASNHIKLIKQNNDMRQLVAMKDQANSEKDKLADIVESCDEGIVGVDLEGKITSWNAGAQKVYGYTAEETIGRPALSFTPTGDSRLTRDLLKKIIKGQVVNPIEVTRTRKDGTSFYVSLKYSPIRDSTGKPVGVSCICSDITSRKAAENALSEAEFRLRRLSDAAFEGVAITQGDRLVDVNLALASELGYDSPSDMIGLTALSITAPESHAIVTQKTSQADESPYEATLLRRDGTTFPAELRGRHSVIAGIPSRITAVRNISRQKKLEKEIREREAALRAVLDNAPIIVYTTDMNGIITLSEGAGLSALGLKGGEVVGRSATIFTKNNPILKAATKKALKGETVRFDAPTHGLWLHSVITPIFDENNRQTGITGVCFDVTDRVGSEEKVRVQALALEFQKIELEKANEELESLATTDGLTGLKNHRAFWEKITEEFNRSLRYNLPLSVILLDVDHFKHFNDKHGHLAGDAVLRKIGNILSECARDSDFTARYGGEEFVVVLPETGFAGATAFAERLRSAIESRRWPLEQVTASFGVAGLQIGDLSAADILSRADAALYRSKDAGRNRVTADVY